VTRTAYCHIHRTKTGELLSTLELVIDAEKIVPKGELSTRDIDIGNMVFNRDTLKEISFDIINIGQTNLKYKIIYLLNPYIKLEFNSLLGDIPIGSSKTININFICNDYPPRG